MAEVVGAIKFGCSARVICVCEAAQFLYQKMKICRHISCDACPTKVTTSCLLFLIMLGDSVPKNRTRCWRHLIYRACVYKGRSHLDLKASFFGFALTPILPL